MDNSKSGQSKSRQPPLDAAPDDFPETAAYDIGELAETRSFQHSDPVGGARTARRTLPAGLRLGEYELIEEIGRGGMGVVYKARQISVDRIVALKVILAGVHAAEEDVARFYNEAQAAGRLDHPNIVTIFGVGEEDGRHFIAMQFVEGENLAELIGDRPLEPRRAARYLKTVAEVIQLAHAAGIVHRDLKPANVLIDGRDEPLLTDFGLAKMADCSAGITGTGYAIGTPSYMSPEQALGKPGAVGPAGDIYSLGAILYAMLTCRAPFQEETPLDTIRAVIADDPVPPHALQIGVSPQLEAICLKCLRKEPAQRYATAAELAADLDRFLRGEAIEARPEGVLVRSSRWLRGVPIVSALTGKRELRPTKWQSRAQWLAAGAVLLLLAAVLSWQWWPASAAAAPAHVRVAGGPREGMYFRVAKQLAGRLPAGSIREATTIETDGAMDNRARLLAGEAELAVLQADAVADGQLAVVAPLYYEYLFVVCRTADRQALKSPADLATRRVAIGPAGSGTHDTAVKLYDFFDLDIERADTQGAPLDRLESDARVGAALLVSGVDHPQLNRLLGSGAFCLMPLDRGEEFAVRFPNFRSVHVGRELAPAAWLPQLPAGGLPAVATIAMLVTRTDMHDAVVERALEALYGKNPLAGQLHVIDRAAAASWTTLRRHRAAERFFAGRGRE